MDILIQIIVYLLFIYLNLIMSYIKGLQGIKQVIKIEHLDLISFCDFSSMGKIQKVYPHDLI